MDPATAASFEAEALVHLQSVHRFAFTLARDESAAEDLTQDTFLLALKNWAQFTPGTNCRAWLFTICRRHWIRANQRAAREEPTPDADLESLAAAALHAGFTAADPLGAFLDTPDLADALRRAMMKLPETFREAVNLVDLEDESYESAAQILEVPVGTVKSRLFRGRRLLQESLVAFGRDAGLVAGTGGAP